jgi:hypothetical protein
MKKMFGIVVVLLILYIASQIIYGYAVGSRTNLYEIKVNDTIYQVKEIYTTRHRSANRNVVDKNNYYYEVSNDNKLLLSFKIAGNYTGVERFLKTLKIYENSDLFCAYPVFKDKVDDLDVMCNNKNNYYLYNTVKGQNAGLDLFVSYLKELDYNHPSWNDTNLETRKVGSFVIYPNNITDDQNFVVWQYNGFYRIANRGDKYFPLNTSDQYNPNITTMVNQYYVVPDYKDEHKFTRLFVTNLISGSINTLELGITISYDSFIQGIVEDKIYIIDRSSKTQYAIDIYDKKTTLSGDINNSTKYYNNGKWEKKSIYEVVDNNMVFKIESNIPDNFKSYNPLFINEIGGETDGYYYIYIKENNSVGVYRVDKQNINVLTLIFRVPSIKNIKYARDDIYFISNDTLYTYRGNLGLRPVVKYSEFVFNESNLYNVYVEK